MVVHGGTNSIVMFDGTVTDQSAEDIANELLDMGGTCREFSVGKIIFRG